MSSLKSDMKRVNRVTKKKMNKHMNTNHNETDVQRLINGSIKSQELDSLLNRVACDGNDPDFQHSFRELWGEMVEPKEAIVKMNRQKLNRTILSVAASIALVLSVVGTVSLSGVFNQERFLSVATPSHQIKSVNLSDGSHIKLGSLSKLEYIGDYEDVKHRDVKLNGEAYFKVAKNPAKPFIVHTGLGIIKVLGTSFNVRSFNDEKRMEVTVLTGRVSVTIANKEWILTPDNKLITDSRTGKTIVQNVKAAKSIDWTENRINFNNASLREVINRFEKLYGVDIESKGLKDDRVSISGEYSAASLEDNLKMMCFSANLKYEKVKNNYRIFQ